MKALEDRGIGRPSTYASIMGTILDRGYVFKKGTALVPTFLAFSVTKLLEKHFARLVDYEFTALLENDLDDIAEGKENRVDWLSRFYRGTDANGTTPAEEGLHALVTDHLEEIDARDVNSIEIPGSDDIVLRVGKYGPYLQRGDERASVPDDMAPDELTVGEGGGAAGEAVRRPRARARSRDRTPGRRPRRPLRAVRERGARGGLDREAAHRLAVQDDVARHDHARGRAAAALAAADARRVEGGEEIQVANGRYGPYIKQGKETRSLADEEQLFTVTTRGGARAARPAEGAPRPRPGEAAAEGSRRPIPAPASRSSSRKAASAPTSPTARRTRACAAATIPRA